MRISDWSSDVCSSDLLSKARSGARVSAREVDTDRLQARTQFEQRAQLVVKSGLDLAELDRIDPAVAERLADHAGPRAAGLDGEDEQVEQRGIAHRSEEHTSELQSLMRTSYAVFCLKKNIHLRMPHTPYQQRKQ